MKAAIRVHGLRICALLFLTVLALEAFGAPWRQYADPQEAGLSPARLEEARAFADAAGSTAIVAVHKGNVLAAWGEVDRPVEIHSVRKSIFSGLFGIHVASGAIKLDATLEQLGIDDEPPLTPEEKRAKVVDLLRARSGVYHAAAKEPADMKAERPSRGSHPAGEHFFYNNWDFNTLGPILEKATGRKVADELYSRIVKPLEMEDFLPEHASEQLEPSYSIHPAYAFRISARDLARYGQLILQKGKWNGAQIIPESWVTESTSLQTKLPDGAGYGYMWWVYPKGSLKSGFETLGKYDIIVARGTGGQCLLIVPEAEFVVAHTSDTSFNRYVPGPKVWRIAEMILSARSGDPAEAPKLVDLRPTKLSNPPRPALEHKAVPLDPQWLAACVGEYALESQMHVRVFAFDNRMFANVRDVGEAEMFAETETRYFTQTGGAVVEFAKDAEGRVLSATVAFEGKKLTLPRIK